MHLLEVFVITSIAFATFTGLWTIQVHREFFKDFKLKDFFNGRCDSWLYFGNLASTAICAIDVILRWRWAIEIGWESSSQYWGTVWLIFHFLFSLVATIFHVTTNIMLNKQSFCALCRRKFDENDGNK